VIVYRYNVLVYLITFVLSWVVFALLWWALQSWHGGLSCVDGIDGFTSALLFSIETQHTIGYGSRAVTDRCSGALTLLMIQSVFGAITQCVITGIIFAKVCVCHCAGVTLKCLLLKNPSGRDDYRFDIMFPVTKISPAS